MKKNPIGASLAGECSRCCQLWSSRNSSLFRRSEGEISDDDDEDPDFELDSSPNSNHRHKRAKRAKLDDSTLDEEIRLPAKTRHRKKKTNAEIFGSDTDSGSPSPVSRKRRKQCARSSRGKRR